ncbi:Na+/H+ antiporter NhaC family protein [Vulgatibacter incomptus]|uniref:Na+/H+ antiporter n=1 Tax=Vulgatibacter incomptus TaxID=1391653 RepID=A0A0K1P959_9BACT|nr:Na+/H+ antiporter NhaC family protein [Vulgatibacter incomptus]AKU90042.1 Na+/H+ antiporter [Vulgatibacter incomptus]
MKRPSVRDLIRWSIAAAVLALSFFALPQLDPQARNATIAASVDRSVAALTERLPKERPDLELPVDVALYFDGAEAKAAESILRASVGRSPVLRVRGNGKTLRFLLKVDEAGVAKTGLAFDEGSVGPIDVVQTHAPIRPWSVLPPLVAIVLAFATGRLVLSLLSSILLGAALAVGLDPWGMVVRTAVGYGWEATFSQGEKIWIFVFTTALVGLVGLATKAGGIQGVVDRITRVAKGPRSAQFVTYLLGVAIFFDDYANTILVGNTMRPLTDRMRVSREKLAYLVDSTSAPVAGIAVISTWIGYEVGLLGELSKSLGLGMDGYGLFFQALPYRFYCMFTLVFIAILVLSKRDFGPMLEAERRAARTGMLIRPGAKPLSSPGVQGNRAKDGIPRLAHIALLPIGALLAGVLFGLLWDGGGLAEVAANPAALFSVTTWRHAFGDASSSKVLGIASLGSSLLLFGLVFGRRLLGVKEAFAAYLQGARSMWLALAILTLAWGIKAVCDDLGTSHFLVAGLQDVVHPRALPLLVFFLAALIAFATGTSWGTMGILIPTAAPLAYHLAGPEGMFLALAAVLDGAIYGDHVSPISDTTVMSSIASGSDHLDHVRTQLPYATVALVAAALFGYVWNAMGWGYGIGWILGPGSMAAVILLIGKNPWAGLEPAAAPASVEAPPAV